MNLKLCLINYNKKKYTKIIESIKKLLLKKTLPESKKIFYSNLLACSYVNINRIDLAVEIYQKANLIIRNFDGPLVKYNIGIIPENLFKTDKNISLFIKKLLRNSISAKKIDKKNTKDLINSLKVNPKVKGSYHSNIGLTLLILAKLKSLLSQNFKRKDFEKILYSNYKYNSFLVEDLLKKKLFKKFRQETKKILNYNSINMRLFAILSYAIQKYGFKNLNYFCSNPLLYVKEYNLVETKEIKNEFIEKLINTLSKVKKTDSYSPGSIYSGYKSIGNIFDTQNRVLIKLKKIFSKKISEYLKSYRLSSKKDFFIKNYPQKYKMKGWYIRIKNGGGIDYHIHNAWLSGVFYIQLPKKIKSGTLDLSLSHWGFSKDKKYKKKIYPEKGKLVLFPSSLPHKVSRFDNKNYRISIAFDIVPNVN